MSEEDVECPACGKGFEEQETLNRHYGCMQDDVHEGSIAYEKDNCNICGDEYEYYPNQSEGVTCGDEECLKQIQSIKHSGENNPNYGKDFSGDNNPFYGKEHTEETKQEMSDAKQGENNPFYGLTGKEHPTYGHRHTEETKQKMSDAKTKSVREYLSKINSGENHPMYGVTGEEHHCWKENTTTKFSPTFYRNRPKVLERDEYECRVCEMSNKEHNNHYNKNLMVHHIIPRSEFIDESDKRPPNKAAQMNNLISVCENCHKPIEYGLIDIYSIRNNLGPVNY